MPLLDHFHPPLSVERHWESSHAAWCGSLADDLNRRLPPGYFAEEQTHAGPGVEIDVAAYESALSMASTSSVATLAAATWSPPAPALSVPAVFADDFEVRVFANRGGPTLVAAIELISPGNKDRHEARRAFAIKCASYLHQGISLLAVDIVTGRHAQLHEEIMRHLGHVYAAPVEMPLFAVAYRPLRRVEREEIDVWPHRLRVGQALPTLPLFVSAELVLPLDLEATYTDACRRRRLENS